MIHKKNSTIFKQKNETRVPKVSFTKQISLTHLKPMFNLWTNQVVGYF